MSEAWIADAFREENKVMHTLRREEEIVNEGVRDEGTGKNEEKEIVEIRQEKVEKTKEKLDEKDEEKLDEKDEEKSDEKKR